MVTWKMRKQSLISAPAASPFLNARQRSNAKAETFAELSKTYDGDVQAAVVQ